MGNMVGPDVMNVIGYPASGVQLFRDFYSEYSEDDVEIIVPDGLRDGDMQQEIGNSMNNVTGTAPAGNGPNYDAFVSLFEDEYGEAPGVFTSQTFDAVALLMLANAAAGENSGPAIRDQLRRVANPGGTEIGPDTLVEGINAAANGEEIDYQGASSSTNFDERGDPAAAAYDVWEFDGEGGTEAIETISFESEPGGDMADESPGGTDRTVMVGLILPESGDLASVGGQMIEAGELAAQIVSEGDANVDVDLSFEDTQTDPQAGISAAESLVNQGYPCIAGPASSGVNVPVSEQVFIPNEIVSCSPSSTALSVSFLEDDDFVFRTAPSDLLQGQVMAEVAAEQLDGGSTSTMYVNNDYGQQLSEQYTETFSEDYDGEVFNTIAFEKEQSSYSSRIQEALSNSS
jgi:ABC-type branched-subunit amino acid transport system substrate-binding protein